MDMGKRLDLRVTLDRHRIESHLAEFGKGRLQRSERLHRGLGTHMLVALGNLEAQLILHRDHGVLEITLRPRIGRALLAFDRERIDIVARETVKRRNQISGYSLRYEIG